jgi:superfamily II DNA/RNA helicase
MFWCIAAISMFVPGFAHGFSRALLRQPLRRVVTSRSGESPVLPDLAEFRQLGLIEPLIKSLKDFGFETPSPIQRSAIPEALSGQNLAFAATTGSGKTLGYLLPAIQAMKTAELEGEFDEARRPRVIVLVPTRELAEQVLSVAKKIAHHAKFRSCMIVGGDDYGKQRRQLEGVMDLVVASPGRLLKHRELGHFHLSKTTHVVIDEVDTMLVQGFGPEIKELLGPILFSPQRREAVQFVVATATMTKAVRKLLDEGSLPPCRLLETSDLGQSVPSASHRFVLTGGKDKLTLLKDLCLGHSSFSVSNKGRTMVSFR